MMRAKRTDLTAYICGFAFLLGGMSGCLTGFLCSGKAQSQLTAVFYVWHTRDASGICFAAELLVAVFALILSLVVFGYVLIPFLNAFVGYAFGLALFISAHSASVSTEQAYRSFSYIPDILFLVHIAVLCSGISLQVTRGWTSGGARIFDLQNKLRRIWIDLFFFWILFAIRRLFS